MSKTLFTSLVVVLAIALSPIAASAYSYGDSDSESGWQWSWSSDDAKIDLDIFKKYIEYKKNTDGSIWDKWRDGDSKWGEGDHNDHHSSAVPEPGAAMLFGAGITVLGVATRRRF